MDSFHSGDIIAESSELLLYGLGGFIATIMGIPLLRKMFPRIGVSADTQKNQKWNPDSPPTVGGLMLFPLIMVGILVSKAPDDSFKTLSFVAGTFCGFLLGLYDDVQGTNPFVKLLGQFITANLFLMGSWMGHFSGYMPLDYSLSVLIIIFIMNAFNLIDNMDGIAGCIALIWAMCFLLFLDPPLPLGRELWAVMCGGLVGFLAFNLPPAKVFMGDVGTQMLGALFAVSVLSVFAGQRPETLSAKELIISMVPLGYFVGLPAIDTLTVLLQRPFRGVFPFYGGKDHITHFIAQKAGERTAIIIVCILQPILSGVGVYLLFNRDAWLIFMAFLFMVGAFVLLQFIYYHTFGRFLCSSSS